MSEKTMLDALNKLCKWRRFFASWQIGTTRAGDGPYRAVAHHRELSILLRTEVTALTALMIRKGVFTQEELQDALEAEAELLDQDYGRSYPGWSSTPDGMSMQMPQAGETMRRLGFPP
jgi:hypothetical protein